MDTVAFEMPLAMCRVVGPWARHAFFCIPATPVADIMQENVLSQTEKMEQ